MLNYSLKDLFIGMYKKIWIVLLCIVVFCGAIFGYSLLKNKKYYSANTKIYVKLMTPDGQTIIPSSATLEYINQKINDSFILLQGQTYSQLVADKANEGNPDLKMTYQKVQASISFSKLGNSSTSVISVAAKAPDPSQAQYLADCASSVINEYLTFTESLLVFQVYESATLPTSYTNSINLLLYAILSFFLALAIAVSIIAFIDIKKGVIFTSSQISNDSKMFDIEILTIIPSVPQKGAKI